MIGLIWWSRGESTCICGYATNNCSHQFLNWWQELSTGQFHLDGFDSLATKRKDRPEAVFSFGGAEGNRTPVRKQLGRNFSGRSLLFTFPHPGGNKHPTGISSFMMRGMGKAYHTHVLHSNHTRARLVDLPGRMRA